VSGDPALPLSLAGVRSTTRSTAEDAQADGAPGEPRTTSARRRSEISAIAAVHTDGKADKPERQGHTNEIVPT
jgi:hypothetical protein